MHANSHHRPLLFVTVTLQRGVATAAAVGPAQAHHLSLRLNSVLSYGIYRESALVYRHVEGIHNVPPNGVFGNKVYGSDSEFRLCNSDEWRSGNHGGRVIIRGYGGGDMVFCHGLKGCLDHRII
ncbi:hypothetical protein Tco_0241938 [Tanacetum coccineum]